MTKISNLEQKTYQGKPSGFKITFDDGRSGNLQEKESTKGLRIGDEVNVKEIPYTSKAGVASTLYGATLLGQQPAAQSTPQQQIPPPRPQIHVGSGKSIQELKSDATTQIMLKIMDAFYEAKLESAQIATRLQEFDRLVWSEIDEVFRQK